ncbi:Appr-1-p processing domain protein (plasmid) [Corynebacterium glyciniphilum AJ 3170]|uniref:Appr-1-p processing domain protein n=1 Tax=Corynebacterium glyciniphilum AJ 3170 TaxID=1404245 RepID=X5DWP1_9CORY|nr:macro domain-containing protein [Corynebacterium glyciniphilum]AHW65719.1 Appr-1-p processing domain protein [Corynebacterium glyciniphilum AJ 3170]
MMIAEERGNLLKAPVEALVNTVNTQGVMGKGIALQFKKAFPDMFKEYARAAKHGEVQLGHMHVWTADTLDGLRYIINFPTKDHWRSASRITDVEAGLQDLVRIVRDFNIASIAVPPLGCGNGGLSWAEVRPLIHEAFRSLPNVDVRVFPPQDAPAASSMQVNSAKPEMTPGRAALVGIISSYIEQGLTEPTLIETQKLMYFLQLAGEPLRLQFSANRYGPYADNLRHVLIAVEGHYLTGYGDGSAKVLEANPLMPVPGATELANKVLSHNPETRERMGQVLDLAAGYESAYGMELLATVHWVTERAPEGATDEDIARTVADWSARKARMFTPHHVDSALATLRSHGLLEQR